MTRKPPRLFVLALLFWQIAVSMGVTVVHAAAPLEQRATAALSRHGVSAATLASAAGDCPDHAVAGTAWHTSASHASHASHAPSSNHSSNHSSKHDCCGTTSACQCITVAIPFVAPLLTVTRFAIPAPLLAYTGVATAPVAPFFRPPIA